MKWFGHVQGDGDPEADPEHAREVIFLFCPGNASALLANSMLTLCLRQPEEDEIIRYERVRDPPHWCSHGNHDKHHDISITVSTLELHWSLPVGFLYCCCNAPWETNKKLITEGDEMSVA